MVETKNTIHRNEDLHEPQSPTQHLGARDIRPESDASEEYELARLRRNYSRASTVLGQARANSVRQPSSFAQRLKHGCSQFWAAQISIIVPHEACRDHLALERTFLGYLRTSLAMSILGIIVAQLFRLQHIPNPNPVFGFFILSKPLSCICQALAIGTLLLGTTRTWRLQRSMVRGRAITGGFEIVAVGAGVLSLLLSFFVLVIAINIKKETGD